MALQTVAFTDCLDVQTEHEGTLIVQYSNPQDLDGIPYSSISPAPVFSLRIPARLNIHIPRFPGESESMAESDGDVESLMTSAKKQIQLEVGHLPMFMHEKLKAVFMHKTITIGGISFTAEDPYEIGSGRVDYPFRKASIWLTVRGSYKTNVQ